MALPLEDCRHLALIHNLPLRAEREAYVAAGYMSAAELGAFEPDFVGSSSLEYNERLNTVEQQISQGTTLFQEKNKLYSAGIEGLLPTGGQYNVGWSANDLKNNLLVLPTNPLVEQYQTFMGVTLTQPLLKDFGFGNTMAKLRLAKEDEAIARQDLRKQMIEVVATVESAYWDLYVAQERLKLRQKSVDAAAKLLEENKERVNEGKMAEIELVEAQAGLAQRKSSRTEALQRLVEVSGKLRTLFAEPVNDDRFILNASDTPPPPGALPPIDEALRASTLLHPEYLARVHKVAQEKVRIAYAKNQRWPQVDLKASYGQNGLGDTYPLSWRNLDGHLYESWSVGIQLRVPLAGGIRERNMVHAAQAHGRQALLDLKAAEVEIANNIYTAERKLQGLEDVAENYDAVADAGHRLLVSESGRLSEGKSDSRRVIEVENQYYDAEVAALESRGEYEKAKVEFEVACGRLLATRGVDLAEHPPRKLWDTVKTDLEVVKKKLSITGPDKQEDPKANHAP